MKPCCYLPAWWGRRTLTDKRMKKDNDLNFNCDLNIYHYFVWFQRRDHSEPPA